MSSYATPTDLANLALPAGSLPAFVTTPIQQNHLDAASGIVDSFLGAKVRLPLVGTPPLEIKLRVCQLAAFTLLLLRGYNPDVAVDEQVYRMYEDAMNWLKAIARGEVNPVVTDSGTPGVQGGGGPFTQQVNTGTTSASSQGTLTGQVTVDSSGDTGTVAVGSPRIRGWF